MLDAWAGQPAFVLGGRGQVLATNALARALLDAGAHPDDARTTELAGELTLKCPEFSRWWSQHKVLDRTWGHKRSRHPVVGPIEIDYEALHLPGDPDQTLFVYRAPDGDTRSAEALRLLASWNARSTTVPSPATDRREA
jgi:hypothetical protein